MNDDELIDRLHHMGIDEESYRVVALLPLVGVAWADGEVQAGERELISRIAREHGFLVGDGARVLKGWLEQTPTAKYVEEGEALLVELSRRDGPLGQDLTEVTISDVVTYCEEVARAAGGLFGLAFTVDDLERDAIRQVAKALGVRDEL